MNIVIADDELLSLKLTASAVERAVPNADIHTFQFGEQVIEYAESHSIDIAFLDIRMRGISGVEIAQRIQTMQPKVNIIFVTAYDDYKSEAMDLRASGYLTKPVVEADILKEMECLRYESESESVNEKICVRCFGNFQILYRGIPIKFAYQKTLELVAFLIDKKGAVCSYAEISAALWEDTLHLSYLKKLRADLLQTFDKLGFSDFVYSQKGMLGIDTEYIDCDYYDAMNDETMLQKIYHGEYMNQFSWADTTNASLWWKVNHS